MNKYLVAAVCFSSLFLQTTDLVTAQTTREITGHTQVNLDRADDCYRQAVFFDGKGNFIAALANYEQAIALNPHHDSAYVNRGIIYARQGKNDLALLDFQRAIELNSQDAKAFYNRGVVYGKKSMSLL